MKLGINLPIVICLVMISAVPWSTASTLVRTSPAPVRASPARIVAEEPADQRSDQRDRTYTINASPIMLDGGALERDRQRYAWSALDGNHRSPSVETASRRHQLDGCGSLVSAATG